LMLYDTRAQRLHLQRSPISDIPLYWCPAEGTVLAGTSLRSLAGQAKDWQVNQDHLASFLLDTHGTGQRAEATALHPVRRVLPGTRLTLDAQGRIERTRFWDWTRCLTTETRLSRADAALRYRDLLGAAIVERMNGDLAAAEHSGGFDSSSIVCLARNALAQGVGRGPLLTLSLDYPFPNMAGEGKYMRLVTDQGGPIEPLYVREQAVLDFEGFPEQIPLHDEPSGYLFRFGIERQVIDLAADWGARTLLGGGGAELLTEPRLQYLTDLAQAGRWRAAFREARRWAADRQTTVGDLALEHFMTPMLPASWRQGWGVWRRDGYGQWPTLGPSTIAPWILPGFARQARLRDRAIAQVRRDSRAPVVRTQLLKELEGTSTVSAGWYLGVQRKGIVLGYPFQDPRLLAFGLSLPLDVRQEPGQVKPLLAEAMRGILPEPIRTRRYKCGFDRVNLDGFQAALGRLRALVSTARQWDPGIFDLGKLEQAMLAYGQGVGNALVGNQISGALSLLVWLQQLADHPPRAGSPTLVLSTPAR